MKMRKYLRIMKSDLLTSLSYRMDVFMTFISGTLILFVFICLWRVIYSGGGVEGLSFEQMIWYLCITRTVSVGGGSGIFGDIKSKIQSGDIAYQLIRPYNFMGFQMASAVGSVLLNFVSFGAMSVVLTLIIVGPLPQFMPWSLAPVLFSMLLGIFIQYACSMALGFTAFKYEENHGVIYVYESLVMMLGTFIPLEFLPGWLQTVAKSLPFSYVTWAPARLFVGFTWELYASILPMQLFWLAVTLGIAALLYRKGVKDLQVQGG